jgi:hypothetical protein
MRKGAFLMALATAKRASELVSLLSDANHFRWEGENIRFTPSRLTKTDRLGHLSPPFYVKPWKEDLCVCPVETVRLILLERNRLCLQHSVIFFSWTFPHKPLDAAAFNRCIQFCLVKAGIQATSSSVQLVQPGLSPLPPRWPVVPCSAMSYVSAIGVMPRRTSVSIMPFEVYYEYLWVGVMISLGLGCSPVHCLTRAGYRQIGSATCW